MNSDFIKISWVYKTYWKSSFQDKVCSGSSQITFSLFNCSDFNLRKEHNSFNVDKTMSNYGSICLNRKSIVFSGQSQLTKDEIYIRQQRFKLNILGRGLYINFDIV